MGDQQVERAAVASDFADLYRREFGQVVFVVQSLVGRRDLAEEITQDAFIVTYDRWARVRRYARPGDFVRRVALNRAVSDFRRRGAEQRAVERAQRRGVTATAGPEDRAAAEGVWAAVRDLPARQAQAIALTYAEDLSTARVAEILGCSESAVKTHLLRGRGRLQSVLAEQQLLLDGEGR